VGGTAQEDLYPRCPRPLRLLQRITTLVVGIVVSLGGVEAVFPVLTQAQPVWHGEIQRFHEHDLRVWRGGSWWHGWHAGRFGWWWIAGGVWYGYPAPIYPYPDPYTPPVIVQAPSAAPLSPQAPPPAQPQTPAGVWYYCAQPPGYYPYVPTCPSGWQAVPVTPQESPAQVAPPTHEDLQREQRSDVGHGMAMPHLYT
jgi:hypothetical protein